MANQYLEVLNKAWEAHLTPKVEDAPTVVSTFAGCGGSSLGYSMAGFRELLAVEWDDHAVETFKLNFPEVPVYHGDIGALSVEEALWKTGLKPGELDVFDGSPPCFPAGTQVETINGPKAIEEIVPGDIVLTHAGRFLPTEETFVRDYTGDLIFLEFKYGRKPVAPTAEHPFFVRKRYREYNKETKGYRKRYSEPDWVAASEIKPGDVVLELNSSEKNRPGFVDEYGAWIPVKETTRLKDQRLKVYNLEVALDHSYTANGFAAHNCQGFSTAGHRMVDDGRNQLFREYIRLIKGLKAKVIVMENVSGMVKGSHRSIQGEIMGELRAAGYNVSCKLLAAHLLHVPQKRQRLIFIGTRKDLPVMPSHPKPLSAPVNCSKAFEGLPPDDGRTLEGQGFYLWQRTKPGDSFSKEHPRGHWFNSTKLSPRKPAATMTKMCSPRAMGLFHWEAPRILNIAEAKRISSFPDGFRFEGKFVDQWARMGNCVPPLMMKAVADHIRKEILNNL